MSRCLTPVTIKRKQPLLINLNTKWDHEYQHVPCGKCANCIKRRVNDWVFRLEKERERSISGSFLTLTYEDEYLPFSENGLMTLKPKDHQLFMKRLRKYIDTNKYKFNPHERGQKLKYYMVGEYGSSTHRPHYHSIIYNLPDKLIVNEETIANIWNMGRVQVAVCNPATIRYVCGYVNKRSTNEYQVSQHDEDDDRHPECANMSKGIGANYLTKQIEDWHQKVLEPFITIENGVKQPMPRYFRHKLFNEHQKYILQKKAQAYLHGVEEYSDDYIKNQIINNKKRKNGKRKNI